MTVLEADELSDISEQNCLNSVFYFIIQFSMIIKPVNKY